MRLAPGARCPTRGCTGHLLVLYPVPTSGPGALHCSLHPAPSHEERVRLAMQDKPLPVVHAFYGWDGTDACSPREA